MTKPDLTSWTTGKMISDSTEETQLAKVQRQRADFEKALEVALTNCDALQVYKRWAEEVAKPALMAASMSGYTAGGVRYTVDAALTAYPQPEKEEKP